jgi:hypothetical protein
VWRPDSGARSAHRRPRHRGRRHRTGSRVPAPQKAVGEDHGAAAHLRRLELYQPTKATSTKTFLEKAAGLAVGDAGAAVGMARKLGKMPVTKTAFVDGALASGTVKAIVATVAPRILDRYVGNETAIVDIVKPLLPHDAVVAMQDWAVRAHACADADKDKPLREDGYYHSETLGGRYESKGSFAAGTGADIATALRVAQDDNPRDNDTRSPAEKRAEALADIARFYSTSGRDSTPTPTPRRCRNGATCPTSST